MADGATVLNYAAVTGVLRSGERDVLRRYTMPKEETVDSVGVAECRRRTESVGGRHTLNCTDERPDEGDCW